jgi:hypothetical protein
VFARTVLDVCWQVRFSGLVAIPSLGILFAGPYFSLAWSVLLGALAGSRLPNLSLVCLSVLPWKNYD